MSSKGDEFASASAAVRPSVKSAPVRHERLGIVSYTNVAPLHFGLEPWSDDHGSVEFVRGVPTVLNRALVNGEIDLTLISSIEFLRHRHELMALPDFSIATLGPVYSVMLFHWEPWRELEGRRIAVTTDSDTSVELLRVLLAADGMKADFVPQPSELDTMLTGADGALLIGDAALREAVLKRAVGASGKRPLVTDLGAAWYRLTRLPFTFAVWAARADNAPSPRLVAAFRAAREDGLGRLAQVTAPEAARLGLERGVVQRYLANFRYYLEPPDRDGLFEFGRRSLPDFRPDELRFWPL